MAFLFVYYSSASGSEWLTCKSLRAIRNRPYKQPLTAKHKEVYNYHVLC